MLLQVQFAPVLEEPGCPPVRRTERRRACSPLEFSRFRLPFRCRAETGWPRMTLLRHYLLLFSWPVLCQDALPLAVLLSSTVLVIFLLTGGLLWEEQTSIEKTPLSGWSAGKSVGTPSWLRMDAGGPSSLLRHAILAQVVLSAARKQAE